MIEILRDPICTILPQFKGFGYMLVIRMSRRISIINSTWASQVPTLIAHSPFTLGVRASIVGMLKS